MLISLSHLPDGALVVGAEPSCTTVLEFVRVRHPWAWRAPQTPPGAPRPLLTLLGITRPEKPWTDQVTVLPLPLLHVTTVAVSHVCVRGMTWRRHFFPSGLCIPSQQGPSLDVQP